MTEADHDYHAGAMDISEQVSTFHLVGLMLKWGSLAVAVSVTMLVLWFCASAGFWTGLITGIVLLVLGIVFLREKPAAAH